MQIYFHYNSQELQEAQRLRELAERAKKEEEERKLREEREAQNDESELKVIFLKNIDCFVNPLNKVRPAKFV